MTFRGPQPNEIQSLFSSVAHGYDKANDAMTFGLVHRWRKQLVNWSQATGGQKVLDCATGTGDLAIEFKRRVGAAGSVVGTDFCQAMLDRAPAKAKRLKLDIEFALADVTHLEFADNTFDVASIAYGIRNVSDPELALSEMARVVRPGGRVMVLETGDSPSGFLKHGYEFYFQKVVPRLGGWITGQRSAYEYLNRSSRSFPSRDGFLSLMQATGAFAKCEYKALLGGASFMYRGVVK